MRKHPSQIIDILQKLPFQSFFLSNELEMDASIFEKYSPMKGVVYPAHIFDVRVGIAETGIGVSHTKKLGWVK